MALIISGSNQNFSASLTVGGKEVKQFSGKWAPGSTGLKTTGFQFDLSQDIDGSSLVKLSSVKDLPANEEYSFSKD
ncbi:hypothetical protein [Leptospira idonii]|uniref:Uncharacterized protein n=1 Tax=Leptospira idonii TaxID=1193500 RepID=A0A4R9M137_9LEPT|nr:hypothetical protein [Leptospira idonii]TGN19762.1 hypothetical protein EHS15_08290 [Leptospira idonii]